DAGAREFCRRVDQSCVGDGGVGTGVVALGEAEVENFRIATRSDEDVGGLDVAMDDALRVSGGEGVYDLDGPFEEVGNFHAAGAAKLAKVGAVEEFHYQERMAGVLVDFVDGADVRVI